jgi:hypothetical protein
MDGTPAGTEVNALSSGLLQPRNRRIITTEISVPVLRPRAPASRNGTAPQVTRIHEHTLTVASPNTEGPDVQRADVVGFAGAFWQRRAHRSPARKAPQAMLLSFKMHTESQMPGQSRSLSPVSNFVDAVSLSMKLLLSTPSRRLLMNSTLRFLCEGTLGVCAPPFFAT